MCPLREPHFACLRAVADQKSTVATGNGRRLFTIDGKRLTGDLHMAMAGLWLDQLVYGPADAVEPELLWLTEAGEQVLAVLKQNEEIR